MALSDKKKYDQIILGHYQKVAKNNGISGTSSMEDPFIRDSETLFFLGEIKRIIEESKNKKLTILDLGCGNGYLLGKIRDNFPSASLIGLEFTPELFEIAYSRQLENCQVILGDARELSFYPPKADIIITERALINILERKDQYEMLKNIAGTLDKEGHFISVESFKEPLEVLNQAAREMVIEPFKASKHNLYLHEGMIEQMQKMGLAEIEGLMKKNHLSTHFYLTRIFHKAVLPKGGKGKFSLFTDFFSEALPAGVGNFSPILFRVFKKL